MGIVRQWFSDAWDFVTYHWLLLAAGALVLLVVGGCAEAVRVNSTPETYINDPSRKQATLDYLWEKGLRFEEGNANLIKIWAPLGSRNYVATLRVKGTVGIEGNVVVKAYIPVKMLGKDDNENYVDPAKVGPVLNLDYCELLSSASTRGTSPNALTYFLATCKGGEIHFGETPVLIEVEYESSKPYLGMFSDEEAGPAEQRPPFPFRIDDDLLAPLPGENLLGR